MERFLNTPIDPDIKKSVAIANSTLTTKLVLKVFLKEFIFAFMPVTATCLTNFKLGSRGTLRHTVN